MIFREAFACKKRVIAPMDFNLLLHKINDVSNKHFKAMIFTKLKV